jgi:hypothetical protein
MTHAEHPEPVELTVGYDLGTLEIVVARLESDGISARIEPDAVGMVPDDSGGYRLLLHPADLEAARPVLESAGIEVPDAAGAE